MVCVANITQLDPSLFVANSNNAGRASNPHESLIPDGVVDVCCECIEFVGKGRDAGKQGRTMTIVRSDPNPTRPFAKIILIRMVEGSGGQTSSPHFSNAKLYYYRFHTSQDEPNTRITVMAPALFGSGSSSYTVTHISHLRGQGPRESPDPKSGLKVIFIFASASSIIHLVSIRRGCCCWDGWLVGWSCRQLE